MSFLLFRGEVTASVKRIVMTMEVKQKLPTHESPPKLVGKSKILEKIFNNSTVYLLIQLTYS